MFAPQDNITQYSKPNLIAWIVMSFQAGTINTGGYLACHRFVSHVTGFGTMAGTEGARGHWSAALGMLTAPGFFVGGAMLSALFVDNRIQANRRPLYPLVLLLIFILTFSVMIAGALGYFGPFGATRSLSRDYVLLAALCLACGLQNATVTTAFGAIVRTTHLTGITTDLAIGLVRVLSRSHTVHTRENEVRANWMRGGLITGFILGSLCSAYIYLHAQYWGFLIPSSLAMLLFLWSSIHFNRRYKAS